MEDLWGNQRMTAGLGRRPAPDARDRGFLLAKQRVPSVVTSKYWLSKGPVLDQGGTSQCVIYSGDKWLTTGPVPNKSFGSNDDRTSVYKQVQAIDEWDGDSYDGTSVRALFKYLQREGYVSEYRWAFDAETVVAHLLTKGPVILGTGFTEDMANPDGFGYMHATGRAFGGHAYLAIGANRKRKNPDKTVGAVRILNSWGSGWSQAGKAWLTVSDLDKLIRADGEAAVGIEIKRENPHAT